MSTQSAAKSLILEFVHSPQFEIDLENFIQSGSVRSDNLLGILRQFVTSPNCESAHRDFWNAPSIGGPEVQFDESNNHEQ